MDWDNIKYIFQIPLSWFKAINSRVFKAYGQNFIEVREAQDGATEIGVKEDLFAQMVQAYAPSGGGDVSSVDGIGPDANGNVQLNAVKSVDGNTPDANGEVMLNALTTSDLGAADGVCELDSNGDVANDVPISKVYASTANKVVVTGADGTLTTDTNGKTQSNFHIVTDVTWNGTKLQYKYRNCTFTNGLITSIGSESTAVIDTPVTIS